MREREYVNTETVYEISRRLSCTQEAVWKLIKQRKMGQNQGVFKPFDGKRNIRINPHLFLRALGVEDKAPDHQEQSTRFVENLVKDILGRLYTQDTQMKMLLTAMSNIEGTQKKLITGLQELRRFVAESNHARPRKR